MCYDEKNRRDARCSRLQGWILHSIGSTFSPKQQDGWDILSCCFESPLPPQRCPARLFIDDNCRPRSAAVVMGDFVFLSGEPKLSFLKEVAGRDGLLLIARNEGWQEQLPALAGESFADYKCYPALQVFPLRRRKIICSKFSPPCRKE